jgi:hypothetical protein
MPAGMDAMTVIFEEWSAYFSNIYALPPSWNSFYSIQMGI